MKARGERQKQPLAVEVAKCCFVNKRTATQEMQRKVTVRVKTAADIDHPVEGKIGKREDPRDEVKNQVSWKLPTYPSPKTT